MLRPVPLRLPLLLAFLAAPLAAVAGEEATPAPERSARDVSPQAYVLYAQGLRLQYRKEYDAAIATLQKALKLDKDSAAIRFALGDCYRLAGKSQKAVDVLHEALKLQPEYGPGYESLAFALADLGKRTESLGALEQAGRAAIRPRAHRRLLRRLAWIHQRAGDFKKAIAWYEYHLECGYHQEAVYLALGSLYLKTGDYAKAFDRLRHVVRRASEDKATASDVARAYGELSEKQRHAAIAHHEAAVAKDPSPDAHEVLAMAYRAAGRREDMLAHLEKAAAAASPRAARQREFIAEYYEQLGDIPKAIAWRQRILATETPPSADSLVRLAGLYVKHMQMPQAIATYRKALGAAPDRNELRRRIADCHVQLQQWKRAAQALKDYLAAKGDLEPDDAEVVYQLGELTHHAGQAERAAERKRQAFALVQQAIGSPQPKRSNEELARLHVLLAQLYYADEQPDKALGALRIARRLDPDDPKKHLLVAAAHQRTQQWKEAAEVLHDYVKTHPNTLAAASAFLELAECLEILGQDGRAAGSRQAAMALLRTAYGKVRTDEAKAAVLAEMGQIVLRRNDPQKALEHFLDALALHPNRALYHLGLAQCYHLMADWPRAAAHYESYLSGQDDPDAPSLALTIYRLGVAQARSGHRDLGRKNKQRAVRILQDALQTLEKETRGTPAHKAELLRDLASLHASEKDYPKSIRTIRQAIQLAPPGKRTRYQLFLASVLEDAAQYDQAERVLLEAHRRDPDSPDVLNHLGYFYAERGKKLDQAVQLVQKALHYEPLNGAYIDSLAWAYFKQGKHKEARDLLLKALQHEEDAVIRDHLGDAYLKLGNIQQAREAWSRAVALDPEMKEVHRKLQAHPAKPKPEPKPKGKPEPKSAPPPKAPPPKAPTTPRPKAKPPDPPPAAK